MPSGLCYFGSLLFPWLSENPALSQHLLPDAVALAYRGQPTTELLKNAGGLLISTILITLDKNTISQELSWLVVFWPYIVYPTSVSLLTSSPSVYHCSSGISTYLVWAVSFSKLPRANQILLPGVFAKLLNPVL